MFRRIKARGGFVFAELAIALPLLILLMYVFALVGTKIFEQGRNQLADYVLEEEAHNLLQRIVRQARAAKEIAAYNEADKVKIIYRATHTFAEEQQITTHMTVENILETQWLLAHQKIGSQARSVYAEHQDKITTSPITGDNSFGETSLVDLEFSEPKPNVLHITLEMESLVTQRRIKLSTAVYMPACELKSGLSNE